MEDTTVSVVMIFYNSEKFIEESIESVLNQSYRDFELILVNDGSNDSSVEIASNYHDKYPERVQLTHHAGKENRGMSASRNLGIKYSKGEMIAFLDSDDIWLQDKLEAHVNQLRSSKADLLVSPSINWYSWVNGVNAKDSIRPTFTTKKQTISGRDMLIEWMHGRIPSPSICSVLVTKSMLYNCGLFNVNFRGMFEDQVLFVKLLNSKNLKVTVSNQPKDYYRQHSNSCVATARRKGMFLMRKQNLSQDLFMDWLISFEKASVNDIHISTAIKSYIDRYSKLGKPRLAKLNGYFQYVGSIIKTYVLK